MEFKIIWKYYNDLGVIKYDCRRSYDVNRAMKDYDEYRDKWKYISVWVEIEWKRRKYWDLIDIRVEQDKAYQKSLVQYHSKEEILKAISQLSISIQNQRDEIGDEENDEFRAWNRAMLLLWEVRREIDQINPDELTKFIMKH